MWIYYFGKASELAIKGPGPYLRKNPEEIAEGCTCLFSGQTSSIYGSPNTDRLKALDVPGDIYPYVSAYIGNREEILQSFIDGRAVPYRYLKAADHIGSARYRDGYERFRDSLSDGKYVVLYGNWD